MLKRSSINRAKKRIKITANLLVMVHQLHLRPFSGTIVRRRQNRILTMQPMTHLLSATLMSSNKSNLEFGFGHLESCHSHSAHALAPPPMIPIPLA